MPSRRVASVASVAQGPAAGFGLFKIDTGTSGCHTDGPIHATRLCALPLNREALIEHTTREKVSKVVAWRWTVAPSCRPPLGLPADGWHARPPKW